MVIVATLRNALFAIEHGLDKCLGRVSISIGKIHAQTMGGGRPETAALVFAKVADAGAGQAFFDAVLHPVALGVAKEAIVTGDPNAAITGANHGVDAVEATPDGGPVPAIELPDLSAVAHQIFPSAISAKQMTDSGVDLSVEETDTPLFLMIEGGAPLSAQPEITVLRGEKRKKDCWRPKGQSADRATVRNVSRQKSQDEAWLQEHSPRAGAQHKVCHLSGNRAPGGAECARAGRHKFCDRARIGKIRHLPRSQCSHF